MSLKSITCVTAISLAAFVVGCDQEKTPTAAPANPSASTPAEADATLDAARKQAEAVGADVSKQAGAAVDEAKTQAAAAGDAISAQAQKLYDDAVAAIKKADLNDAQKYVDQLNSLKANLPAEWQTKVDEVAKMLTDAKSKLGNLSVPKAN